MAIVCKSASEIEKMRRSGGIVRSAVEKMKIQTEIYTLMSKVEGLKFVDEIIAADFDENDFV